MKSKQKELDVDFIGGQEPMTKEEEVVISKFICTNREKRHLEGLQKVKTKTSFSKSNQPV